MEEKGERFLSYEQAKALLEKIREEILGAVWFEIIEPVVYFTERSSELKALHDAIRKSTGRQKWLYRRLLLLVVLEEWEKVS
jgi:hypothetical protein